MSGGFIVARKVSFVRANEAGDWSALDPEATGHTQEEIFERTMRTLYQAIELYLELLTDAEKENRLGR